jgi:hypothetical protein
MKSEHEIIVCSACGAANTTDHELCVICDAPLISKAQSESQDEESENTFIFDKPLEAKPGWYLTIVKGSGMGLSFPLGERVMIGRSVDADITLADDPLISRHHALLERQKKGYRIHDQDSDNGTFVDETRVKDPTLIAAGARIVLGETVLLVEHNR